MDLRRLRAGEWVVAAAGVVLIASLFLPWYRQEGAGGDTSTLTAWGAFSAFDVVLALMGLMALGVWLITVSRAAPAPGVAAEALLTPISIGVTIACLVRVLGVPDGLAFPADRLALPAETSAAYGAWIGLAACVACLVGSVVGMRDERLSSDDRPTDSVGAPTSTPTVVETLPGPPSA